MNSRHPRNHVDSQKRLPDKYYLRRRVAAVIILLLVIALVIWGLVRLSRSGNTDEVAESSMSSVSSEPSSDPSSEPAHSETSSSVEASTETSAETPHEPEDPDALPECSMEDIHIAASTDRSDYPRDVAAKMYMTVKNTGEHDCVINLSEHALRFEVYDLTNNKRVWSDTDCNIPEDSPHQVFRSSVDTYFAGQWAKTFSAPDSCDSRDPVPEGTYFLHAVIGDTASEPVTFHVS